MSGLGIDIPGYRENFETTELRLITAKGLICALCDLMVRHPNLSGPDPQTGALHALVRAIEEQVDSALCFHE